jgi:hypothetical protein
MSLNEALPLEGKNHLVYRGRGDAEVALQVGFGGRAAPHQRVSVDESQVLPLLWSKGAGRI